MDHDLGQGDKDKGLMAVERLNRSRPGTAACIHTWAPPEAVFVSPTIHARSELTSIRISSTHADPKVSPDKPRDEKQRRNLGSVPNYNDHKI